MKQTKTVLLLILAVFLVASCAKEKLIDHGLTNISSSSQLGNTILSVPVPTPELDWENIAYMPTPPGMTQIPAPWNSGQSQQISPDILHDYKKVDGWELVYNTFSTTSIDGDPYFILYNKYRGLIRLYYYLRNSSSVPSSNIVHSIYLEGSYPSSNISTLIKFAASSIVDIDEDVELASTLEQWQVASSTWYALEYELAYDHALYSPTANHSFLTAQLRWAINYNNIQTVNLGGTSESTLRGSISVPGYDLTINPSFSSSNIGDGNIVVKGNADVEKVKPSITTQVYNTLKSLVTKKLTSVIGGLVENIFSGIFGGKGDSVEDNVNLQITSNFSVQGTINENGLVTSRVFAVPGTNQENTGGFVPAYDGPLGVFYLSNKPTVLETQYVLTPPPGVPATTDDFQYVYTVKGNSFNLIINPEVSAIATIQNVNAEVILDYSSSAEVGRLETISEAQYFVGTSVGFRGSPSNLVGIRVSFDVIPNNGSKKTKIVKTFKANLEHQTVINPPGEEEW